MFRHKHEHEHEHEHEKEWQLAMGTVEESTLQQQAWTYIVDYRRPDGETTLATVQALPDQNVELPVGTQIALQANARTGEVVVHTEQPRQAAPSAPDAIRLARQLRGQDPASVAASLADRLQPGGAEVRVTGGSEVRVVGGAQAAELREAVQELIRGGGSPAAAERIHRLKAELQAQAGLPTLGVVPQVPQVPQAPQAPPAEPESFTSAGPGTFDSVAPPPPATFSSPDPTAYQPGPAFGQPGFSAVAPATTFSSPESPGSFNAGSSTGSGAFGGFGETKSDRIARLEDQRDRGQITPEQFAAQRQQIQDEI